MQCGRSPRDCGERQTAQRPQCLRSNSRTEPRGRDLLMTGIASIVWADSGTRKRGRGASEGHQRRCQSSQARPRTVDLQIRDNALSLYLAPRSNRSGHRRCPRRLPRARRTHTRALPRRCFPPAKVCLPYVARSVRSFMLPCCVNLSPPPLREEDPAHVNDSGPRCRPRGGG